MLPIARINPNVIPNKAANNTLNSAGSRKVIVCAGIQKKGIVFLKMKFHITSQFIFLKIVANGIEENNPLTVPPVLMI